MFDEKSRAKIVLIGVAIAFVAGMVKCFLNFPIVEFYALIGGQAAVYIFGKSYTDGKYAEPTK